MCALSLAHRKVVVCALPSKVGPSDPTASGFTRASPSCATARMRRMLRFQIGASRDLDRFVAIAPGNSNQPGLPRRIASTRAVGDAACDIDLIFRETRNRLAPTVGDAFAAGCAARGQGVASRARNDVPECSHAQARRNPRIRAFAPRSTGTLLDLRHPFGAAKTQKDRRRPVPRPGRSGRLPVARSRCNRKL